MHEMVIERRPRGRTVGARDGNSYCELRPAFALRRTHKRVSAAAVTNLRSDKPFIRANKYEPSKLPCGHEGCVGCHIRALETIDNAHSGHWVINVSVRPGPGRRVRIARELSRENSPTTGI